MIVYFFWMATSPGRMFPYTNCLRTLPSISPLSPDPIRYGYIWLTKHSAIATRLWNKFRIKQYILWGYTCNKTCIQREREREREGGKKDFVHSLHWRYWKKRAFYAMMEAPKNLLHKIEWFTLIPNLMTMINLPCSLHPPPGARYIWTVNLWLG